MPAYKNYLIAFLCLTTIAGGYFSWRQSGELRGLRDRLATPVTTPASKPTGPLQSELTTTEPRSGGLNRAGSSDIPARISPDSEATNRTASGRPFDFQKLMDNPEVQQLLSIQRKGALDGQYAELFKKLGLPPAQLEELKTLLAEKQNAAMDVIGAARAEGLDPRTDREAIRKLTTDTQNEIDQNIRATLGDVAFDTYQNYVATQSSRTVVQHLDKRLSYSPSPLTDSQREQLVQIVAGASAPTSGQLRSNNATINFYDRQGGSPLLNDVALTRAQGILTPDQFSALQQLQQEQTAGQQLQQFWSEQLKKQNVSVAPAVQIGP